MFREAGGRKHLHISAHPRGIWVKGDITEDRKKGAKLPKKGDLSDCKYSTRHTSDI